jgi:hypothetical protein
VYDGWRYTVVETSAKEAELLFICRGIFGCLVRWHMCLDVIGDGDVLEGR